MKQLFKNLLFGCAVVTVSPFYLLYRMLVIVSSSETVFQGFSQFFALAPGTPGNYLRKAFYFLSLKKCSRDCTISFGTIFATSDCEIGKHVVTGTHCIIGRAIINDDVLLASNAQIISKYTHGYDDLSLPIQLQKGKFQVTRIGQDTWIGAGAIVMADIGDHCVVGAGSVVVNAFGDFSIIVGNPARLLRKRKQLENT